MAEKTDAPGLSGIPEKEWPEVTEEQLAESPINRLKPKSELHRKVLSYLTDRLETSEHEMQNFYARWRYNEQRIQAYIDLPKWENELKQLNDSGKPPKITSIVVPYSYATIMTIVTYLLHTFAGRRPMFQVGTYKKEAVNAARMMELVLQYNADHTRMIRNLYQYFLDGELYGVCVFLVEWDEIYAQRTVFESNPILDSLGAPIQGRPVRKRERRLTYSGNSVDPWDPFLFFPDPNVPMHKVNTEGEFVFWRKFVGKHRLKRAEADGVYKWIDHIGQPRTGTESESASQSARSLLVGGNSIPGERLRSPSATVHNYHQIDRGTVDLVPRELGLGESDNIERWIFTIANKQQIIEAEPFDTDHDRHPVAVAEPSGLGYGFGQAGMADYLAPFQDSLSWLINSHMDNVRTALNNMIIVDPTMVEMQDLRDPRPGKVIRLKKAFQGRDVRTALSQLAIVDVTSNHIRDFETLGKLADGISSVTDNLRGLQDPGGRKTATEVRTSGEAAASRLAARARLISAQGIVDVSEMMSLNIQQFMDEDFYISIVGNEGLESHIRQVSGGGEGVNISPEMVVGDFYFPVHDGTLPLDRVALLDIWKELLSIIIQDPEIRQEFSVSKVFEHIAELGGAKNIESFKRTGLASGPGLTVLPDEEVAQGAEAGNFAPIQSGNTPGVVPSAADRIAGGL